MFNVVLVEPEIPPNTGNIIRLCANAGARLHLIHPLGFQWENARLRRAGLDYREWASVQHYDTLAAFVHTVTCTRLLAMSARGQRAYHSVTYTPGDALLFGPESRGLPPHIVQQLPPEHVLRIPMRHPSRSLNLSNAVAIVLYEAWRQVGFCGGQ